MDRALNYRTPYQHARERMALWCGPPDDGSCHGSPSDADGTSTSGASPPSTISTPDPSPLFSPSTHASRHPTKLGRSVNLSLSHHMLEPSPLLTPPNTVALVSSVALLAQPACSPSSPRTTRRRSRRMPLSSSTPSSIHSGLKSRRTSSPCQSRRSLPLPLPRARTRKRAIAVVSFLPPPPPATRSFFRDSLASLADPTRQ